MIMDATTTTPPLPISDLHRLQLEYQCLTPVSSNGSGSPRESEYPCLPDYLPQPQLQYYSPHPHHANPHQPPPSYYHQQHPHPHQQHQHQHQEPHQQHPYLKAEYGYMPFDMAGVPHAVPQELVGRNDFSDDGSKAGVVEMDQEEVDAIIRNKRKVRDPKACYACHRRKVKCDRNLPCDSCVKRDHPELCSYERPTKKRRIALSNALAQADGGESERIINSGPNITVPKEQWERINRELAQLKTQHKDTGDTPSPAGESQSMSGMMSQSDESFGEREGVHAPSNQMGTMHLGSRSVLAYMIGNRTKSTQDAAMSLLEENILPNLGLDNETTTYPFVDLWSTDSNSQNVDGLIKALPDDHLCREFWLTYRDIPCTIYPVVPDCDAFNQTVNFMLQTRADMTQANTPVDPNRPYGVTLPWLALFFAVLASGSQSTGRPAKERELTSQVYICCSYQALRMSNFLTHPSLETMQALLIIGNALSYNMNPGVSYILLGMTLRSAFSMGLHVPSSQTFSEQEQYHRSRIWWALAWQDSHFSVSYDRPSASILCAPELPYTKQSSPGARSYVESMANIIKVTQSILRDRQSNPKQAMSLATIIKYKDEVHRIWSEALPRLRNRHQCVSMTDHLERLALSLHCAYMISEICRPVLKEDHHSLANEKQSPLVSPSVTRRKSSMSSGSPGSTPGDSQTIALLRAECINYLEKVVETYVELREINKFAARSWIGIQRSISAAFLLGVLPETKQEPRVIRLLTQLERGIEQSAIEDSGFPIELDATGARKLSGPEGPSRDAPLWVRSMTKSLNALSKLNVALSGGKAAAAGQFPNVTSSFNGAPQQHQHQQMHVHQSQAAPPPPQMGMYNTPNMSPTASNMIAPVPMTMQQQFPMMHNMQSPTHMSGPSLSMGGPQMIPTMGPFSPDSSMSEPWNYGNLTERALEYVQPGLWG